ncbi:hypothetical protein NCCP1664_08820 [Zafaria cholistanensis]|uniref:Uncharacterized protein n=1 Tax=Zafaria cholistanensis TaxID=1682741 RepID=A0A5A7NNC0_9MICC|nr:hypothetical protein [Zafaria cholistanensis]GER22385.1 hypothetical protein NCCP1664_08820 [Zafaria cholistanensis]
MGENNAGPCDSGRNDDFLDSADWMADVPAAPAFEEEGWLSDELDERIDMVICNPGPPLRFVRPHSMLAEDPSGAKGPGLKGPGFAEGLAGGGSLAGGPGAGAGADRTASP